MAIQALKTEMAHAITRAVQRMQANEKLSQGAVAKRLNITQPRLSALVNKHLEFFSLDALVRIGERAGLQIYLIARK